MHGASPDLRDHAGDVFGEIRQAIGRGIARFRRVVVAAQIDGDHVKARRGQRRDLMPPRVPELRKAVQQDDERTAAGFDVVDGDAADVAGAIGDVEVRNQRHREHCMGLRRAAPFNGASLVAIQCADQQARADGEDRYARGDLAGILFRVGRRLVAAALQDSRARC